MLEADADLHSRVAVEHAIRRLYTVQLSVVLSGVFKNTFSPFQACQCSKICSVLCSVYRVFCSAAIGGLLPRDVSAQCLMVNHSFV